MKKSKRADQSAKSSADPSGSVEKSSTQSGDALQFLEQDHGKVEALFKKFEGAQHQQAQGQIAKELCAAISTHVRLMEDVVYPELRLHGVDSDLLDCAQVKLDGIKLLVNDLQQQRPDAPYYRAKIKALAEQVKQHASEQKDDRFFAKAREAGIDVEELGGTLATQQQELAEKTKGSKRLEPLQIRSFGFSDQQEKSMTQGRYGQPGRDRHQDDDDNGTGSQGGQRGGPRGGGQDTYGQQYRAGGQPRDDDDYQSGQSYQRGGRYGQSDHGDSEGYGQRQQYGRGESGESDRGQYRQSGQYGQSGQQRRSEQAGGEYPQQSQYGRDEYSQQGNYGREYQQPGYGSDRQQGYRGERYGRTEEFRETRGGMQRGQGDWQNEDQERYGEGRSSQRYGYDEERRRFSDGPSRERRDTQSDSYERRSHDYGQRRSQQAGYENDYDDRRGGSRSRTQDDDSQQTRRGRNGNGPRTSTF